MAGETSEYAFLQVEFSISDEHGALIETTDDEDAKNAGIFNESSHYGPSLVILGEDRLVKGFRNALSNAKINEENTVRISKEDAFGERREDLVVLVPAKKFEKADISPQVGMIVDMDGQRGRVQSISGGRIRVDLNHELAGKNIIYKFKIVKRYESAAEKLEALLEENIGAKNSAKMNGESALISVTPDLMKEERYLQGKYYAIQNALQYIPELKKIEWKEEFVKQ